MDFAFIPAGTEETASSRIRVYTIQRALSEEGIAATIGYSPRADVLLVQKRLTTETLALVRQAKAEGRTILYDVDDLGPALWYWTGPALFDEMLCLAHAVLCATPEQCHHLRTAYKASCVEVVPCAVDYYPSGPSRLPLSSCSPLRVLWFGSVSNIRLFEQYVSTLATLKDVQLVVVTDAGAVGFLAAKYPEAIWLPWSLSTFTSILQSCQLTCLMHDGSRWDRAKSNNRMVTSIAWGVPAVVSCTPEYERTAIEAMVRYAIFAGRNDLPATIERLRPPEVRDAYLDTAQTSVWPRYSPRTVAAHFLKIAASFARPAQDGRT